MRHVSESQQEDTVASLLSLPSPIGLWIGLNAAVSLSSRRSYGNVGNNQQRSSRSSSITVVSLRSDSTIGGSWIHIPPVSPFALPLVFN